MPPTLPTTRQPQGGSTQDQKVGPGEKTVSESSATPTAREVSNPNAGRAQKGGSSNRRP